jgi:prevent-host-death family protein
VDPGLVLRLHAMGDVASRELRNNTRALLDRVDAGESITIAVDSRPVAALVPLEQGPRWMPRDAFIRTVISHQADPAPRDALRELAPDSTDDLPWR